MVQAKKTKSSHSRPKKTKSSELPQVTGAAPTRLGRFDQSHQAKIDLIVQSYGVERIHINEPISNHTQNQLGGIADSLFVATTEPELVEILNTAHDLSLPNIVIGSGTKSLISEKGIRGLVIKNKTNNMKVVAIKGKVGREGIGVEEASVEASSGVTISALNDFLLENNLQPIEGSSNVSGSIGGSILSDNSLSSVTEKLRVWEQKDIYEIEPFEFKKMKHVILGLILKVKAAEKSD